MASKEFVNGIAPNNTGKIYNIIDRNNDGNVNIINVTEWEVEPSTYGAGEILNGNLLECDHSKVGTTHYIENPNKNIQNIKFYARANYVSGDRILVNNETHTAAFIDGSLLANNAFVTGQMVVAYRYGNHLTLSGGGDFLPLPRANSSDLYLGLQSNAVIGSNGVVSLGIGTNGSGHGIAIGAFANTVASETNHSVGRSIAIGSSANARTNRSICIGPDSTVSAANSICIGSRTMASGVNSIVMGADANGASSNAISIGVNSSAANNARVSIGYNARSDGIGAIAIGYSSRANGTTGNSLAIGNSAYCYGTSAIAIGYTANANGFASIAIGKTSQAIAGNSICIGNHTSADTGARAINSIAIGSSATSGGAAGAGYGSIAIGANTGAEAIEAIAIGNSSLATGTRSVSIGVNAQAENSNYSVSIGYGAKSSALVGANITGGVSVGHNSTAAANYSVAIGSGCVANEATGISIGYGAIGSGISVGPSSNSYGQSAISLGNTAVTNGAFCMAIGRNALARGTNCISIGYLANSGPDSPGSISVGAGAQSPGATAIAIGHQANATGDTSVAIALLAKTNASQATAIGYNASGAGAYSIAIGRGAIASGQNSIAIGSNTNAWSLEGISIGARSFAANSNSGCAVGVNSLAYGWQSTAIGFQAEAGNSDANVLQLGGGPLAILRCRVQLSVVSDERDKTDISSIDKSLEFIKSIDPISYYDNARTKYLPEVEKRTELESDMITNYGMYKCYDEKAWKAGKKKGERRRVGVKAQQVQEALTKVYGTPDYANIVNNNLYDIEKTQEIPDGVETSLTVTYANFIPFLIGAIQELSKQVDDLKQELKK